MPSVATPSRLPAFGRRVPPYLIPGNRVSVFFTVVRGDESRGRYDHLIFFKNDEITVDGEFRGKVSDPKNQAFLKSLHDHECPADFHQEGVHLGFFVRSGDKDMPVADKNVDFEKFDKEY